MKKLVSVITSAVMTLCILSVFIYDAPADCSADGTPLLTAGDIELTELCGTTVEVRGDSVYIGMFDESLNVTTTDDFSCRWADEEGYYFTPARNGKYQLIFPCGGTLDELKMCLYNMECHDNTVDIRFSSLMIFSAEAGKRVVNIIAADGKTAKFSAKWITDLVPAVYYSLHLFFDEDYWLYYTIDKDSGTFCRSLYIPLYNNDDLVVADDTTFIDVTPVNYGQNDLLPEGTPLPAKIVEIESSFWLPISYGEIPESINVALTRTNGYETKYMSFTIMNEMIIPSTLKITDGIDNDINLDRIFNVADVVMLQKQLLGIYSVERSNWRAADICRDGTVDVFDLVCMRKALIAGTT